MFQQSKHDKDCEHIGCVHFQEQEHFSVVFVFWLTKLLFNLSPYAWYPTVSQSPLSVAEILSLSPTTSVSKIVANCVVLEVANQFFSVLPFWLFGSFVFF